MKITTLSLLLGLKECNASLDEKRKMMEILARVEKETADNDNVDEEVNDNLHERLQDLDLDKDIDKIWTRLNEKVRHYVYI